MRLKTRRRASKRLVTGCRVEDPDFEPIRLVEAQLAVELLERYRTRAGIGSIELERHMAFESAKVSGAIAPPITKSMIDSWRARRSRPGSQHLPGLKIFFRSKKFRRLVKEAVHLWDPLDATIEIGVDLMQWEHFDMKGSTAVLDGTWLDFENINPAAKVPPENDCLFIRIASVPGYSFAVAHLMYAMVRKSEEGLTFVGHFGEPQSGFVFMQDDEYIVVVRNRTHRKHELRLSLQKTAGPEGVGGFLLGAKTISATNLLAHQLPGPDETVRRWPMARDTRNITPFDIRKSFDTFLWSVLPHG